MASKKVLEEAINKLKFNTNILLEKRKNSTTKKQVKDIDKQIAQNNSMILDYQFRIMTNNE